MQRRASAFLVTGSVGPRAILDDADAGIPPIASPDWDLLEADVTRQALRVTRAIPIVLISLLLVGWMADLLFLHKERAQQAIFTTWRIILLVVLVAMSVTLERVPAARRHPVLACAPFTLAGVVGISYFVGRVGGLEQPFFYMLCAILNVPVAAPAHLPKRVAFLAAMASALVAGFFGASPAHARSPLLGEALFFLGVSLVGSVIAGHLLYASTCQRFFQGLALARTARAFEALNGELDARVRTKTAELAQLAEHLQLVQEEERGRIARDLHDELGQRLSAMRFTLARTRQRFARSPATVSPDLAELDTMLDGTLECSRSLVSGLRPPVLDQLGLAAAIEWLARRMGAQAGIDCSLALSGDDAVSPTIALATYRVLQESLTNVTRHSGARRMEVCLAVSPERLTLQITDDGRGFPDGDTDPPSRRNGLVGMRERAYALGGELVTLNAPDGGARVRLCLPLSPPTSEDLS